jgi:hypothetical protein
MQVKRFLVELDQNSSKAYMCILNSVCINHTVAIHKSYATRSLLVRCKNVRAIHDRETTCMTTPSNTNPDHTSE